MVSRVFGSHQMQCMLDRIAELKGSLFQRLSSVSSTISSTANTLESAKKFFIQYFSGVSSAELSNKIQAAFKKFDSNDSDQLDIHELGDAFAAMGLRMTIDELEALLAEFDLNQDGFIDSDEFEHLIRMKLNVFCLQGCKACRMGKSNQPPHGYRYDDTELPQQQGSDEHRKGTSEEEERAKQVARDEGKKRALPPSLHERISIIASDYHGTANLRKNDMSPKRLFSGTMRKVHSEPVVYKPAYLVRYSSPAQDEPTSPNFLTVRRFYNPKTSTKKHVHLSLPPASKSDELDLRNELRLSRRLPQSVHVARMSPRESLKVRQRGSSEILLPLVKASLPGWLTSRDTEAERKPPRTGYLTARNVQTPRRYYR
eukprot:753981-Hanusia_phi.AAC.1